MQEAPVHEDALLPGGPSKGRRFMGSSNESMINLHSWVCAIGQTCLACTLKAVLVWSWDSCLDHLRPCLGTQSFAQNDSGENMEHPEWIDRTPMPIWLDNLG